MGRAGGRPADGRAQAAPAGGGDRLGLAGGVGVDRPATGAIADAELAVAARRRATCPTLYAAQAALTWRRRRQRRRRVPAAPRPSFAGAPGREAVRVGGAAGRAVRRADLPFDDAPAGRVARRARHPARLHAHRSARAAVRNAATVAGKVWVANFIFTSCQQACPLLSERMAEVGRRARHLGPDFHLVSISVDPERDTPAKLAEYARALRREPDRVVVPDRPGGGHPGRGRRRLQGRRRQGARRGRGRRRPTSGRSSTARTWCSSIASCESAATSPRRPTGSNKLHGSHRARRQRRLTAPADARRRACYHPRHDEPPLVRSGSRSWCWPRRPLTAARRTSRKRRRPRRPRPGAAAPGAAPAAFAPGPTGNATIAGTVKLTGTPPRCADQAPGGPVLRQDADEGGRGRRRRRAAASRTSSCASSRA